MRFSPRCISNPTGGVWWWLFVEAIVEGEPRLPERDNTVQELAPPLSVLSASKYV